ncbi:DUF2378 family protein [Corallococcus macrosporus]|uniref:TIGR02265 family protein n=2 Tax=Myxococcaceae TaxID=31 RepID=A0A250JQV3_9BACT|nr:DUF2378 family protein [Corallococcus macrosporus]AEI62233.1 hypothetical protein LILAB_01510 [Corallococcus macrosporus]ATB45862.1 hypothetical protein MYMAC_001447 [Corallococcus macrosporus DSM 14697]
MADELLIFEQTIEALFLRALHGRLTPECKARLRQAGLDLDQKLRPAYAFDAWMTFLRIAAEELFPQLPLEQGTWKLGEAYIEGFRETMLGRAVLSLLRVLGPRRTLMRATQNFRAGNNYTESKLRELGPCQFELWMNEVGPYPAFTAGIIHAGLKVAGAQDILIEMSGYDGHACVYRINWNEASVSSGVAGSGDSKAASRSGSINSL